MSADFDPYQKWLGIPPAEQPPTHYRLLNLPAGEDDSGKIASVLKRLTAYCQARAKGQNGAHALRVLESVAAAEACLLDPQAKAAYDASLNGNGWATVNDSAVSDSAVSETPSPSESESTPSDNYQVFAPVVEAASLPAKAKPIEQSTQPRTEPSAEPAVEESFFDGMDFSAPRSTDAKKPAGAKPAFGKPAAKSTAPKLTGAIGKPKSAAASSNSAGGKFKLETWQIYAMAAGGLAIFILAVVVVVNLNSGPEPKKQAAVVKNEARPQFVPAPFDAAKAAEETAKRKRVPLGKKFVEAPITRVGDFFFTEVTINGKPAGTFLLDTGSILTVMKETVAAKLGLVETRKALVNGVGGAQSISYRNIASLKVKDAHWEDLNAAVMDIAPWEKEIGAKFDGVLGRDIWYSTMFAIDPGKGKVIFYDHDEAPISDKATLLTVIDNRPCIEVQLDGGKKELYMLATGCNHELVKMARDADGDQITSSDGPEQIGVLSIFGHEHKGLTQSTAPLNDVYAAKSINQAGVVGAHILAQYMLVMDLKYNKIMVVPQKK